MSKIHKFLIALVLLTGTLFYFLGSKEKCPAAKPWMLKQIQEDITSIKEKSPISKQRMDQLISNPQYTHLGLVKYTIQNNRVTVKQGFSEYNERVGKIKAAIKKLCRQHSLPDMEFLFTVHDELNEELDVPIFVMAKKRYSRSQILIPDFEALEGKYQVLEKGDITKKVPAWEMKKNQMIWRGSTAQHPLFGNETMRRDNMEKFSRVRLCQYAKQHPQLVDAGFTIYVQGAEVIDELKQFQGEFISFKDQLNYKYHMLIDGNSCSYSASGWKFFSNSLVFKPDSESIQWYYNILKPYVHYIPVKEGLEDLVEKIEWAKVHDREARLIAHRARDFALNNLTRKQNCIYFYHALVAYNKLNFVE